MNRSLRYLLLFLLCGFVFLSVPYSPLSAGETWDKIKEKTSTTKKITQLKMMRSKYRDKIKERSTELGQRVYEEESIRAKVAAADSRSGSLIHRIDVYNKKIDKVEQKIAELERGEEVTVEDIEAINEGIGLEPDELEQKSPETAEKDTSEDITHDTTETEDDEDDRYAERDTPND